jgi:hypothetical protein
MIVPLDFLVCNFGLCLWPFRGVPSASLAEPDLDDAGLLIRSASVVDFRNGGEWSKTGSGIDEIGFSLRSEPGAMAMWKLRLEFYRLLTARAPEVPDVAVGIQVWQRERRTFCA